MAENPPSPGWWRATDGQWYPPSSHPDNRPEMAQQQMPPRPGWWRAADGQWYPPPEEAAPQAQGHGSAGSLVPPDPVAYGHPPGWWFASDGRWYPPQNQLAPSPSGTPAVLPTEVIDAHVATTRSPQSPVLNTVIPRKAARYFEKRSELIPGEEILAVAGQDPQVLIATDRRLLIVKVGITAGVTGGGRTTAINYADVTAIQVQLGMMMGSLAVQSPGYGATQTGDYWSLGKTRNPLELPNVIPWSKQMDKQFEEEVRFMRSKVDSARTQGTVVIAPNAGAPNLAEQLRHLAELHRSGDLSADEYAAAKARLLNA